MAQISDGRDDRIEQARKLFAQPCDFMLAAAEPAQYPDLKLHEIAFIGRSNVGKSSLINALTGRKNLARASNTPGRTQQVIFFNLGQRLILVDLPGYGHAEAPREEKDQWDNLAQHYLRNRRQLECVCLLIDARHGIKTNDVAMMKFLDRAAVSYQVVLTKADQIRAIEREPRTAQITALLAQHVGARPTPMVTSAEDKSGIEELRVFLAGFTDN